MQLEHGVSFVLAAAMPIGALIAASCDAISYTIPNWLTAGIAMLFIPAAFAAGLPASEILLALGCGAAVLAAGFVLFALGWFGGGDAKLAAALACWLGWQQLPMFLLVTSVLGGLMALLILLFRAFPARGWLREGGPLWRLHDKKQGVPYGVALGTAALWAYAQAPVLRAVMALT